MNGSASFGENRLPLETLLDLTIDRFTALDTERLEGLAAACGGAELPCSAAGWRRAAARHRTLGLLIELSARRLEMLRRVSSAEECFSGYGRQQPVAGIMGRMSSTASRTGQPLPPALLLSPGKRSPLLKGAAEPELGGT